MKKMKLRKILVAQFHYRFIIMNHAPHFFLKNAYTFFDMEGIINISCLCDGLVSRRFSAAVYANYCNEHSSECSMSKKHKIRIIALCLAENGNTRDWISEGPWTSITFDMLVIYSCLTDCDLRMIAWQPSLEKRNQLFWKYIFWESSQIQIE